MLSSLSDDLVILVVIGLLIVIMRWVFRPSRPRTGRLVDATDARELGLLDVVATLPRDQALAHRSTLDSAGIRTSLSRRADGRLDVLVFHHDADRARTLLNGH